MFLKNQIDLVAIDLSEIESNIKSFQEEIDYLLSNPFS